MSELADFCIIGVRVNKPESTGKKILVDGALYTMLKGYDIEGDENHVSVTYKNLPKDKILHEA